MLEISKEMKRRDLPKHIMEGLEPFSTLQIKFLIGGFTFFLLDALIFMPLFFPVIKTVLYVTLPLMILISIWALWLLIRKAEDTEIESLLFLGCLGSIGSFCYFIVAMKYAYMLGIESPVYYIVMFIMYLLTIYIFVRHQLKKYSSLEKQPDKQTPGWHYKVLAVAVPAGYIVTQYVMGLSSSILLSFMTVIFLGMSVTFIFVLARSFHKYFFIKKNMHLVKFANKKLNQKRVEQ